jgi:hypothetical protein
MTVDNPAACDIRRRSQTAATVGFAAPFFKEGNSGPFSPPFAGPNHHRIGV